MHIIVVAIGSEGDINPMIEIGAALKNHGHQVDFLASGYFENKIAEAGLNPHCLGDRKQYEEVVKNPEIWHPRKGFQAIWKSLKDYVPQQYELIESLLKPEKSILVATSLGFAARLVAEKHQVKQATVHLSPSVILSAERPPHMPGLKLPGILPYMMRKWVVDAIDRHALDPILKPDMNRIRENLELQPIDKIMSTWMHSTDQVILAFPSWYAPAASDWPKNHEFTGFPLAKSKAGAELSDGLRRYLADGAEPILFTAGSAMAHGNKFFETARKAAAALGKRAVFVNRFDRSLNRENSDSLYYSEYEPFDLLFPKVAAVVHHGGIGTSAQAMKAATPQLVVPFAHDQFDNAERLTNLGIAEQVRSMNVEEWQNKLNRLLGDSSIRSSCQDKSGLIERMGDTADRAACAIESLAT